MTDFVDRLLGRGGTAAIRPLIPALFEPLPVRRGDEPLEMGTFTDTSRDEPVGAATESVGAPGRDPRPVRVVEMREPLPADRPRPIRVIEHELRPDERPPRTVEQVRPGLARPVTTREPTTQPQSREQPPPHTPLDAPTVPSPPRPSETVPAVHAKPRRNQPVSSPAPLAASAAPVTRRAAATRAGRAPEPEVRISIGRVEIRSVAAATEPTRRSDPPRRPNLSLDDYLRDRDGGDRP
ncbi:hypothetical protein IU450_13315 [Nocardia abscessus]|uniref:hypothetical protein n=1 Tax=Nocardia abscessus TaxID=120957 RepID=UPI001893D7E7|nr:hypothetical protein [Nocardia abscessus]MBF6336860.1 hypothetical protein [Nocardia abscessus]